MLQPAEFLPQPPHVRHTVSGMFWTLQFPAASLYGETLGDVFRELAAEADEVAEGLVEAGRASLRPRSARSL